MSFMQVAAGGNIPFEINVVVEIPAFSDPVNIRWINTRSLDRGPLHGYCDAISL
jgi:hypothetical protein